jgi:hypothetical protein
MKTQLVDGAPIADGASKVCILFDPKDGRVAHVHGSTVIGSPNTIADSEMEERARQQAANLGRSTDGLKALHLPFETVRQHRSFRVNEGGDGLIPLPPPPVQKR